MTTAEDQQQHQGYSDHEQHSHYEQEAQEHNNLRPMYVWYGKKEKELNVSHTHTLQIEFKTWVYYLYIFDISKEPWLRVKK